MKHTLRSKISARCLGARASQEGAVAPLMVLALVGGLLAVGYAVDALRMTSDASQLKRATDAAALAIGREYLRSDKDFDATSQMLAQTYVRANLGLDSELRETLSDVRVIRGSTAGDNATFEVTAQFTSKAAVSGFAAQTITIRSKVEAQVAFTEVALVLPSRFDVDPSSEAAMTRIGQSFAESVMRDDGHVYMSVVPYSQNVNVYDAKLPNRARVWARADALQPEELKGLNFFNETGIEDLASPDTPDAQGKRFCPLRGLNLGENYFWDQAPVGQFYISYWVDRTRSNVPPGYDFPWKEWFITPRPTNDEQGCTADFRKQLKDSGQDDCFRTDEELDFLRLSRIMISNKGCPATPVLPLRNRLEDITSELDLLKNQHIFYKGLTAGNLNFGFALGWGAMTLAPAFRGSNGWGGDPQVPHDFDSGNGERQKAIVMLMKVKMDSFNADSDSSTDFPGNQIATGHDWTHMADRYARLCDSLRTSGRRVRVFLLVMGGTSTDPAMLRSGSFGTSALPGFRHCSEKTSDISFYAGDAFNNVESAMTSRLGEIASELKQRGSFVRLIQ